MVCIWKYKQPLKGWIWTQCAHNFNYLKFPFQWGSEKNTITFALITVIIYPVFIPFSAFVSNLHCNCTLQMHLSLLGSQNYSLTRKKWSIALLFMTLPVGCSPHLTDTTPLPLGAWYLVLDLLLEQAVKDGPDQGRGGGQGEGGLGLLDHLLLLLVLAPQGSPDHEMHLSHYCSSSVMHQWKYKLVLKEFFSCSGTVIHARFGVFSFT